MAFPADMTVQGTEQRFGVALGVRTRNPDWPVVILRTSDDGTIAPATASAIILRVLPPGQLYTEDVLENDGATRWYFGYHYRPTYDTTLPTTDKWIGAAPADLDDMFDTYQNYQTEGMRRVTTLWDQDSIIKEEVSQVTADVSRQLLRGYLSGLTSDGGAVTFAQNYNTTPTVVFSGGISYEPSSSQWTGTYSSTKAQYQVNEAQGLSVAGFTAYAKLIQLGTPDSTGSDFPSNTLSSQGAVTLTVASSAPTSPIYTTHYDVDLHVVPDPGEDFTLQVEAAVDSYDGSAWTERLANTYSLVGVKGSSEDDSWSHEEKPATILSSELAGSSSENWRLRVKTVTAIGKGAGTFEVHGYTSTDTTHGVTWTLTSQVIASQTPLSGDTVKWEAWEY